MTPEVETQIRAEVANLKELVLAKIDALEKVTSQRFVASDQALNLQAAEYERRLNALNGEAERLREMQSTYLPRELYEQAHSELCKKVDGVTLNITQSTGRKEGATSAWLVVVVIINSFLSIAGIAVSLIK